MGIKICPECGGKVSEALTSCPHCSYSFLEKKTCPDCGESCTVDTDACPECGHIFSDDCSVAAPLLDIDGQEEAASDEQVEEEDNPSILDKPDINKRSRTIFFGLYPQSRVTDEDLIFELGMSSPLENERYLHQGKYYEKCVADPYKEEYKFDDGGSIVKGKTYWFRCDPIEWQILRISDGICLVVSKLLLDVCDFGENCDNYVDSNVRWWLNHGFLKLVFPPYSPYIKTTKIDNSSWPQYEKKFLRTKVFACEDTNDEIILLSREAYDYTDYFANSEARQCKTTDWARANGAWCDAESDSSNGRYWTRSPSYKNSNIGVCIIDNEGEFAEERNFIDSGCCIRPALTIDLSKTKQS